MLGARNQSQKSIKRDTSKSSAANDGEREKTFKDHEIVLDQLRLSFIEKWNVKREHNAKLDDFERFRTLGTGAFGRVILVKYKPTSTYYAMKILEKDKLVKTKQIEHTCNEKKVLHSLKFPFVVSMEYYFKDNTYLYMVLPFIAGGEMFSHLRRMGN